MTTPFSEEELRLGKQRALSRLLEYPELSRVFPASWVTKQFADGFSQGLHSIIQFLCSPDESDTALPTMDAVLSSFDWTSRAMKDKLAELRTGAGKVSYLNMARAFTTIMTELYFAKHVMNCGFDVTLQREGPDLLVRHDGIPFLAVEITARIMDLADTYLLDLLMRSGPPEFRQMYTVEISGRVISINQVDELIKRLHSILNHMSQWPERFIVPADETGLSLVCERSEVGYIFKSGVPHSAAHDEMTNAVRKALEKKAANPNQVNTHLPTLVVVELGHVRDAEMGPLSVDGDGRRWFFPVDGLPNEFDGVIGYCKTLDSQRPYGISSTIKPGCSDSVSSFVERITSI